MCIYTYIHTLQAQIHEAARACLLLDFKRFLQQAYANKKDKTDFPVEIAVPMQVVGFYDTHCTTHFSTHRLSRQIAVPCRLVFFYCA